MSHIEFAAKVQTFIANLQILSDAKRRKMLKKETQKTQNWIKTPKIIRLVNVCTITSFRGQKTKL